LTVTSRLPFFSPGGLFRREVKAGTALGKKIAPIMAHGGLIGDRIVSEMVDEFLGRKEAGMGAVFDGYPRTIAQMRSLQKKLDSMVDGPHEIYAILIDVSGEEVKKRLTNRRVCKCGETFHLIFKPPREAGKCDRCGRRLVMRRDDRPEVIAERLAIYRRHIGPVLSFLRQHHELLKVNGEKSIGEVEKEIRTSLIKHKAI